MNPSIDSLSKVLSRKGKAIELASIVLPSLVNYPDILAAAGD